MLIWKAAAYLAYGISQSEMSFLCLFFCFVSGGTVLGMVPQTHTQQTKNAIEPHPQAYLFILRAGQSY